MTDPIEISSDGVSALLGSLTHSALEASSPTYLPTQLPLAFPTPLHTLNTLTVLHLVANTLNHHSHAHYLASKHLEAKDVAIRGVLGMYLASEESWSSTSNFLSKTSWKSGKLDEAKVSEIFGITVMVEKQHPTMSAVRVGERDPAAVALCGSLVQLFKGLGGKLPGRCVGEVVGGSVKRCMEGKGSGAQGAANFAKEYCTEAIQFDPSLTDRYPAPHGTVLPGAPLRLLQDLAYRQKQSGDLDLPLPHPGDLANISPLPIPIRPLLYLDILDISSHPPLQELAGKLGRSEEKKQFWESVKSGKTNKRGESKGEVTIFEVDLDTYKQLQTASVEACREIWGHARFGGAEAWQSDLSMGDVARLGNYLDDIFAGQSSFYIVPADPVGLDL